MGSKISGCFGCYLWLWKTNIDALSDVWTCVQAFSNSFSLWLGDRVYYPTDCKNFASFWHSWTQQISQLYFDMKLLKKYFKWLSGILRKSVHLWWWKTYTGDLSDACMVTPAQLMRPVLAETCPVQWVTLHNTTLFTTIPTKCRLHVCGKYHRHKCMQHANVCCALIMLLLLNAGHVSLLVMWN